MIMITEMKIQYKEFLREYCLFARSKWGLIVRRINVKVVASSPNKGKINILISRLESKRAVSAGLWICLDTS